MIILYSNFTWHCYLKIVYLFFLSYVLNKDKSIWGFDQDTSLCPSTHSLDPSFTRWLEQGECSWSYRDTSLTQSTHSLRTSQNHQYLLQPTLSITGDHDSTYLSTITLVRTGVKDSLSWRETSLNSIACPSKHRPSSQLEHKGLRPRSGYKHSIRLPTISQRYDIRSINLKVIVKNRPKTYINILFYVGDGYNVSLKMGDTSAYELSTRDI